MPETLAWRNPRLSGRIPELDGIRGLAILLVVVFHYFVQSTQVTGRWLGRALVLFRLGFTGVDLFFVLSGFLIGGILYDARFARNYYPTFYGRRFYRILPVYFGWLVLFLIGLYLVRPIGAPYLHRLFNNDVPFWSYPLFLQNFFTAFDRRWGPEWLSATWSLAVEEQFYLLLPFAIRVLRGGGITRITIGAILLAPVVRMVLVASGNSAYGPYVLLPCRADALGFGLLLALACRSEKTWEWFGSHRKHVFAVFLLLGLGVAFMTWRPNATLMSTIGYSWIGLFYASLMLLVLVRPGRIEQFVFRSPLLVSLGTYSYAIYVIHYGIFGLCHYALRRDAPSVYDWPSLGVTLLALVLTIICAVMSWRLLEHPLIRRAHSRYRYE
jgi:peptidoglycan/LPS O-acetylase OafA/YrhL